MACRSSVPGDHSQQSVYDTSTLKSRLLTSAVIYSEIHSFETCDALRERLPTSNEAHGLIIEELKKKEHIVASSVRGRHLRVRKGTAAKREPNAIFPLSPFPHFFNFSVHAAFQCVRVT